LSHVVLDASAALSFVLKSQSTPKAQALNRSREADQFISPDIFIWEVGNVLVKLRRRGVLSTRAFVRAYDDLAALEIDLRPALTPEEVVELGDLAFARGIRLFDAAYLALAIERNCALASRDIKLLEVAAREVPCIDLNGDLP
jgi:predicted nucleic acid-binding protein